VLSRQIAENRCDLELSGKRSADNRFYCADLGKFYFLKSEFNRDILSALKPPAAMLVLELRKSMLIFEELGIRLFKRYQLSLKTLRVCLRQPLSVDVF
jgi:hypothetical protein